LGQDPAAAIPLHEILSAQILVEWQASPNLAPNRYILSFAHHILFDYAIARLLLRGPSSQTINWLASEPDLLIAVRPSLMFHFQHLWNSATDRSAFWNFVFELQANQTLLSTGKIIGPIVAAESIKTINDCQPLLTALRDQASPHHIAAMATFQHLMGAVQSSNDPERPLTGAKSPPWCWLLKEVASL